MLRIIQDGENRHRLESDDGTHIGWIRDRVVGFNGFPSQSTAIDVAVVASKALEATLRGQLPSRLPRLITRASARLVHDGAHEWISDGRVPIARLLRVRGDDAARRTFGLEFVLPSHVGEGTAILAAHALGRVIEDHLDRQYATRASVPDDAA